MFKPELKKQTSNTSKTEPNKNIEEEAIKFASLIFDIYKENKNKERSIINNGHNNAKNN